MESNHLHISQIHADHRRANVAAEIAHRRLIAQVTAGTPGPLGRVLARAGHLVGSALVTAGHRLQEREIALRAGLGDGPTQGQSVSFAPRGSGTAIG